MDGLIAILSDGLLFPALVVAYGSALILIGQAKRTIAPRQLDAVPRHLRWLLRWELSFGWTLILLAVAITVVTLLR